MLFTYKMYRPPYDRCLIIFIITGNATDDYKSSSIAILLNEA